MVGNLGTWKQTETYRLAGFSLGRGADPTDISLVPQGSALTERPVKAVPHCPRPCLNAQPWHWRFLPEWSLLVSPSVTVENDEVETHSGASLLSGGGQFYWIHCARLPGNCRGGFAFPDFEEYGLPNVRAAHWRFHGETKAPLRQSRRCCQITSYPCGHYGAIRGWCPVNGGGPRDDVGQGLP